MSIKAYSNKMVLPITFSTHNRTKCACYCLINLLCNLKFDGRIHLYVCDDRSTKEHLLQIQRALKNSNCSNYTIVKSNGEHWGYGYALNTALDQAFKENDVALTIEDDWLLEHEFDFTPLVKTLLQHDGKYAGIRVANADGYVNSALHEKTSSYCLYEFLKRKHRYNLQCMLRHRNAFQKHRFRENCRPRDVELQYKWLNVPVLQALRPDSTPIFTHVGIVGTHSKMPDSCSSKYSFLFSS